MGYFRVKKKSNTPDSDAAANTEAAISTDKAKRRLKKNTRDRTSEVGKGDITDGIDRPLKTQRKRKEKKDKSIAQENLGYDDGGERETSEVKRNFNEKKNERRASENLEKEEEGNQDVSVKSPEGERQKTGKRRRKKLKGSCTRKNVLELTRTYSYLFLKFVASL